MLHYIMYINLHRQISVNSNNNNMLLSHSVTLTCKLIYESRVLGLNFEKKFLIGTNQYIFETCLIPTSGRK